MDCVSLEFPSGVRALDGVSLGIRKGQFVAIVGPSGCGKSTLLRLAAGLLEPSQGTVTLDGQPPALARSQSQRLSFVFQDPTLLPWRSVRDNVRLPLELLGSRARTEGVAAEAVRPQLERALASVGLAEFGGRLPRQLSGGMRMRASLARALVVQPDLMLLDEPFAALDDLARERLNEELHQLWQQHRWTALFVTHNISEAALLAERILVLSPRPGRVVADVAVPFAASERTSALRGTARFAEFAASVAARAREAAA